MKRIKLLRRRFCKCGCGQKVKNRFIRGHYRKGRKFGPLSKECKDKISLANKGQIPWIKGRHHSLVVVEKIRQTSVRRKHKPESIEKIRLANTGKKPTLETIEKLKESHIGQIAWNKGLTKENNESIKVISKKNKIISQKLWQDPDYVAKQMKSRGVKPNKLELFFEEYLNNLYPNKWKYVGNGQLIINGKCPDFVNVNGQKKLIELYGNYWHRNDSPENRIKEFKSFGWDTLILWESDIRKSFHLKNIIDNFIYDRKLLRRNKEVSK